MKLFFRVNPKSTLFRHQLSTLIQNWYAEVASTLTYSDLFNIDKDVNFSTIMIWEQFFQWCFNIEFYRWINVEKSTWNQHSDVATSFQHVSTLSQRWVFAGNTFCMSKNTLKYFLQKWLLSQMEILLDIEWKMFLYMDSLKINSLMYCNFTLIESINDFLKCIKCISQLF